jgi:hypothetical protein
MSRFAHTTPDLDTIPPCVLAEIDDAWERASMDELELHFALGAVAGSVRCSLRDADGNVVSRLSASEALALACGDVPFPVTA